MPVTRPLFFVFMSTLRRITAVWTQVLRHSTPRRGISALTQHRVLLVCLRKALILMGRGTLPEPYALSNLFVQTSFVVYTRRADFGLIQHSPMNLAARILSPTARREAQQKKTTSITTPDNH